MQFYIILFLAGIIAITVHEFTKALVSTILGDNVPKNTGRLTLNPIKHFEPIGFLCIVMGQGYGWGKPTQTSSINYKNKKWGTVITYSLPSVANVVVGYAMIMLWANTTGDMRLLFAHVGLVNLRMAFFNLIPIYPLDGAKVLSAFLSPQKAMAMAQYEKILQMLLLILIITGLADRLISPMILMLPFIS